MWASGLTQTFLVANRIGFVVYWKMYSRATLPLFHQWNSLPCSYQPTMNTSNLVPRAHVPFGQHQDTVRVLVSWYWPKGTWALGTRLEYIKIFWVLAHIIWHGNTFVAGVCLRSERQQVWAAMRAIRSVQWQLFEWHLTVIDFCHLYVGFPLRGQSLPTRAVTSQLIAHVTVNLLDDWL